ncbi:RRQRL motif-containing zinc-binding protein [Streptomyces sp. NPDC015144]|uniref:RRQRL motif-containing zinc-binding protein n=1 Tax=Streptomyces sp. NPDC015144 TaxID=3364944 RepID=UPI0036F8FCE2
MRFYDPTGDRYGIPTYPRRLAPEGLATRRQLRAQGLRPAGQAIAAQILWHGRRDQTTGTRIVRAAYLYRIDRAAPVRPMTPARQRAVDAMLRARRTCPVCAITYPYTIPTSLGCCPGCDAAPAATAA